MTILARRLHRPVARSIAFTCLLTAVVSAQGGTDPVRLYNEAQSRESTLRVELAAASADPRAALATRRRLRTLVGAYRDLARLFPTSGIADKCENCSSCRNSSVLRTTVACSPCRLACSSSSNAFRVRVTAAMAS